MDRTGAISVSMKKLGTWSVWEESNDQWQWLVARGSESTTTAGGDQSQYKKIRGNADKNGKNKIKNLNFDYRR